MESAVAYHNALALLDWQVELGAVDAIGDTPINRYELADKIPKTTKPNIAKRPPPLPEKTVINAVAEAQKLATGAADLSALATAMQAFEHCDLKRGARNFIFANGAPNAKVMIISETPDRNEDREGRLFVGQTGALFDAMFKAIGMVRDTDLYITSVLPWRGGAADDTANINTMQPFLERHIALVNPDILVLMGNGPCLALLGKPGVTRLRGAWATVLNRPTLPMFHPAHLLKNTVAKREAWADLLALQAKLKAP